MRRLVLASFTAATAVALAGCGGDPAPKPKALPTPTTSTSPSASPTPTPPVVPKAAGTKDKAGAIAFARTFIETVNYAQSTGDTAPLRKLYIQHCTRCEAFADAIDKTYANGGSVAGGDWRPTSFKYYGIDNEVAFLDATVHYDRQVWVRRAGATRDVFRATDNNLKAFNLRWTAARRWAVSALDPNE